MIDDLTRGGTLLDRIFSNREEVLGKVKSGSNVDCCEQEIVIVDFMIPRGENKANSIITILISRLRLVERFASKNPIEDVHGD